METHFVPKHLNVENELIKCKIDYEALGNLEPGLSAQARAVTGGLSMYHQWGGVAAMQIYI